MKFAFKALNSTAQSTKKLIFMKKETKGKKLLDSYKRF